MTGTAPPAFLLSGIRKAYGALRPLRLQHLEVPTATVVALMGLDASAAEILVNLLTGATLPDEGEVRVFGRATSDITDGDEWVKTLDRFGILSDRAVLLDGLTVAQNLAMTMTLEIDPLPPVTRERVTDLAREAGLAGLLDRQVATLTALEKLRLRLGRAVALDPSVLLLEHPTATLAPADVGPFAADVARTVERRGLTAVAVTADATFASAITPRVLRLVPADGSLVPVGAGAWRRVKRLFGAQ